MQLLLVLLVKLPDLLLQFLPKGHHLSVMVRLILVLALRLGLAHSLDGLLEAILGLLEVILRLVALLLQEVKFSFPEGLVLIISVLKVLVTALVIEVFLS